MSKLTLRNYCRVVVGSSITTSATKRTTRNIISSSPIRIIRSKNYHQQNQQQQQQCRLFYTMYQQPKIIIHQSSSCDRPIQDYYFYYPSRQQRRDGNDNNNNTHMIQYKYFSTSSHQLLGHSPMSPPRPINNNNNNIMNPGGDTPHMGLLIPNSTYIPTAYEAMIGGVWQLSTYKRDTLLELKSELPTTSSTTDTTDTEKITLDTIATERQKLDLYLCDGIQSIIKNVEENQLSYIIQSEFINDNNSNNDTTIQSTIQIVNDIIKRIIAKVKNEMIQNNNNDNSSTNTTRTTESFDKQLNEMEWNYLLTYIQNDIENILQTTISLQPKTIYNPIRDYTSIPSSSSSSSSTTTNTTTPTSTATTINSKENDKSDTENLLENEEFITFMKDKLQQKQQYNSHNNNKNNNPIMLHPNIDCFIYSMIRYQLHLTLSIIKQLQISFPILTTITDQDMDRMAVQTSTNTSTTIISPPAKTLPVQKLLNVLEAYLLIDTITNCNSCDHVSNNNNIDRRFGTLWDLIDKDNDGYIDQNEMNAICTISLQSTQNALKQFVQEIINVIPMDQYTEDNDDDDNSDSNNKNNTPTKAKKRSWMQRRRIKNDKLLFIKRLQKTINQHFDNELEMSHRLRCIYTWANKEHQNNKIDSILVQDDNNSVLTNVVGRKRYVELYPKITLQEFYTVQSIHLPQFNTIGYEYIKALREDLWIIQGKQRQNRILQRDCALFLLGVCTMDFIILSL